MRFSLFAESRIKDSMACYKRHMYGSNRQYLFVLVVLASLLLCAGGEFVLKEDSEDDKQEEQGAQGEQV